MLNHFLRVESQVINDQESAKEAGTYFGNPSIEIPNGATDYQKLPEVAIFFQHGFFFEGDRELF